MQRILIPLITALCAVVLMACQSSAGTPQPQPTQPPALTIEPTQPPDSGVVVEPVVPDSETGIVRGRIISSITTEPLTSTVVAFAEVTRQDGRGAFVLDTASSPMNVSDVDGYFIVAAVPPGEYVMVVGDPYGVHEIVENPSTREAQTYFVEKGRVTEVGEVNVNIES